MLIYDFLCLFDVIGTNLMWLRFCTTALPRDLLSTTHCVQYCVLFILDILLELAFFFNCLPMIATAHCDIFCLFQTNWTYKMYGFM